MQFSNPSLFFTFLKLISSLEAFLLVGQNAKTSGKFLSTPLIFPSRTYDPCSRFHLPFYFSFWEV